jgi:CPA1 family monovalent cation:H+ antiporter
MQQFLYTETLVIALLLIVSLVAMAVQRFRIPYTVALVLVGLLITTQSRLQFELTPELILALFVPPLVFEAAFQLNFRDLQRSLPAILLLAVPGVLLTTGIIADRFGIRGADRRHRPGRGSGAFPHAGRAQTTGSAGRR